MPAAGRLAAIVAASFGTCLWLSNPWSQDPGPPTDYTAHSAVRVFPENPRQRDYAMGLSVDVWSEQLEAERIDLVVGPEGLLGLQAASIEFEVLVDDIEAVAEAERTRLAGARAARPSNWFSEYRNFHTVDAYLDTLVEARPDLASVQVLGHSVEGRPIRALRISAAADPDVTIALNGGQHAREWIGVMVPTCVADRLVRRYDDDSRVRAIVDASELFVIPVANPDGYEHSWNVDRYWRKSRGRDHGVDLNRNYGTAWGGPGSSDQPRSQIYRGPHAFSEPESQALRSLFETESVDAHIDFHSFSQLILHPWGHTKDPSPDHGRFSAIADRMASAIYDTHGETYRVMSGRDLYPASGTMIDWAYGEHEAVSFVFELRPNDRRGFVLPPEEIIPTCDESYAAVLELAESMIRDAN